MAVVVPMLCALAFLCSAASAWDAATFDQKTGVGTLRTNRLELSIAHRDGGLQMLGLKLDGQAWPVPPGASIGFTFRCAGRQFSSDHCVLLAVKPWGFENPLTTAWLDLTLGFPECGVRAVLSLNVEDEVAYLCQSLTLELEPGAQEQEIEEVTMCLLGLPFAPGSRVTTMGGEWGKEWTLSTQTLEDQAVVREQRRGRSTNGPAPWITVTDPEGKRSVAATIAWSGNWRMAVEPVVNGSVLTAALSPWEFGHQLQPNHPFECPKVILAFANGDADPAARELVAYGRSHLHHAGRNCYPIIQFNTWYAHSDRLTMEILKRQADAAKKAGCEVFVIDAGWYGGEGGWSQNLGHWHPNPRIFPDRMKEIEEYVHRLGMGFGMWVEIENAAANAPVRLAHPEWLCRRNGQPVNNRSTLCLGLPEVREWLLSELDRIVRDHKLDWIKMDFNTDLGPGCNEQHGLHGRGDGLYRYYEGLYEVMDALRERHPGLVVENCSSGGLRMDWGVMGHTNTSWISDEVKPRESLSHIYGATMMLPAGYCNHWTVDPDPNRGDAYWDYCFRIAMLGQYGLSGKIETWPPKLLEAAARASALYRLVRDTVARGAVYHLSPQLNPANPVTNQVLAYVRREPGQAVVFGFRVLGETDREIVRIPDLDPDTRYMVRWVDGGHTRTLTGRQLAEEGVELALPQPETSAVVLIGDLRETQVSWAAGTRVGITQTPDPPRGLGARAVPNVSGRYGALAELTWEVPQDEPAGCRTFAIYRSDALDFQPSSATRIGSTMGGRWIDFGLKEDAAYYYRVTAVLDGHESAPSTVVEVRTPSSAAQSMKLWEARWVEATAGWGSVERDLSCTGDPLTIGGKRFPHGIGTHADSVIRFNIGKLLDPNKQYVLRATIGIDDSIGPNGENAAKVRFRVLLDGKPAFDSGPVVHKDGAREIAVPISGATRELVLLVDKEGEYFYDHADWAEVQIEEVKP